MPTGPFFLSPRRRRQVLPTLTLLSLSALAATSVIGTYTKPVPVSPVAAGVAVPKALAAAVATPALGSPVTGVVASAPAVPGWVSVKKGLALQAGLATTAAPSAQPLRIAVSLNLRNLQGLQAFIDGARTVGSPLYGQTLTPTQFNAAYAPTVAQAQAVSDYLARMGFRDIQVAPNRALVLATGTAGLAETAFNTQLVDFAWSGQTRYANTTDVQVPSALDGTVLSVLGLNNIPSMRLAAASARSASVVAPATAGPAVAHNAGYTAGQYATAYNAYGVTPAYGTTVAIITGGTDLTDVIPQLRLAERVNKLPVVPVKVVQVVPVPNTQTLANDGEWDLDSQASTGIAENVQGVIFYNGAGLDDVSIIAAANQFATDNVAKVGNMSFGGCENLQGTLTNIRAYEQAFMQAVAQGQTWFASTGDSGGSCFNAGMNGTPAGVPGVEYPASSPNVVGVGATTLNTDANYNYVSEAAWISGGGGISNLFAAPQWQIDSGAVPSAQVGAGTTGAPTSTVAGTVVSPISGSSIPASEAGAGRGLPDMAMAGDEATGFITYVDGSAEEIGGTSLSSPLAMGSYARMQSAHCNALPFAAPLIYKLDTAKGPMSEAKGFNDVLVGSTNVPYVSTTGWDYTTGFGSFNIGLVNGLLPAAAASCVINHRPIARLTPNTNSGPGPLSVVYSGTASSDPDNDAIVQYTLDYGDNSDPVTQTMPVFPAHSYPPGSFTATLLVRDAAGSASLPATQSITVYGVPQACTAPGPVVLTSPAGVTGAAGKGVDTESGQDDVLSGSVAEPSTLVNKLVFTLKVNNLTGGPMAGNRWMFFFNIPEDSNNYYVAMTTGNGTSPVFNYGIRTARSEPAVPVLVQTFQALGTLDPSSNFTTDGTITLVLDKSLLKLKTGDALSALAGETRTTGPDSAGGAGVTLDFGGAAQPYVLIGNDVCAADVANPTGPVNGGGTTTPTPTSTSGGGTSTPTSGGTGGGTPTPTSGGNGGGTPTPTSGGNGGTPSPSSGGSGSGSTPTPASSGNGTGTGAGTGAAVTPVVTGTTSREVEAGRGGTGSGALGWMVLLPLSAGALRRRKLVGRRPRA